jgi:pentatricopeptide repeat protein
MRNRRALFFILSLALAVWVGHPLLAQNEPGQSKKALASNWQKAHEFLLKGKDHFAKKEFDSAEAEFRACLEVSPENADALFFLAQVHYAKGDFAQALAEIRKAEAAQQAFSEGGGFVDAEGRQALLAERAHKEEEIAFREQLLSSGDCKTEFEWVSLPEAVEGLRREIASINDILNGKQDAGPPPLPADYSFIHGNILFKMNTYQEAEGQYLKAIAADPSHLPAYNNLVNLCYVTGDFEKALKFVEQAEANGVEINPKLKEAVTRIAKKDN